MKTIITENLAESLKIIKKFEKAETDYILRSYISKSNGYYGQRMYEVKYEEDAGEFYITYDENTGDIYNTYKENGDEGE